MRLGRFRVQLERLATRSVRSPQSVLCRRVVHVEQGTAIGHAGVGQRVRRVHFDGALEHLAGVLETFLAVLVKELAAAQVVFVGVDVSGRNPGQATLHLIAEDNLQLLGDGFGDVVLDGEYVFHLAIVAFGPEVVAVADFHQLCGDA